MPIDWKATGQAERLLAAVIGTIPDARVDMHLVATLFGQGATYSAIENHLRSVKKEAAKLRQEYVDNLADDLKKKFSADKVTKSTGAEGDVTEPVLKKTEDAHVHVAKKRKREQKDVQESGEGNVEENLGDEDF